MSIKVFQIKVRIVHANPLVKMSPRFYEGIVLSEHQNLAEQYVIDFLSKSNTDPKVSFEVFRVTKLKSDFIMAANGK